MASSFRNALDFLNEIGLYDVVLPFVLVFTLVFAILEKTRILGEHTHESYGDKKFTKKNLNAIVAMVSGFLVVASAKIVGIINEVLASVALILVLVICFLLLVGAMHGDEEFSLQKNKQWLAFLTFVMFAGIVFIFLNAMDWLQPILWFFQNLDLEWVSSLLFLAIVVGLIFFITQDPSPKKDD